MSWAIALLLKTNQINTSERSESEKDLDNKEATFCFMPIKVKKDEDSDHEVSEQNPPMMIYFALSKKCIET